MGLGGVLDLGSKGGVFDRATKGGVLGLGKILGGVTERGGTFFGEGDLATVGEGGFLDNVDPATLGDIEDVLLGSGCGWMDGKGPLLPTEVEEVFGSGGGTGNHGFGFFGSAEDEDDGRLAEAVVGGEGFRALPLLVAVVAAGGAARLAAAGDADFGNAEVEEVEDGGRLKGKVEEGAVFRMLPLLLVAAGGVARFVVAGDGGLGNCEREDIGVGFRARAAGGGVPVLLEEMLAEVLIFGNDACLGNPCCRNLSSVEMPLCNPCCPNLSSIRLSLPKVLPNIGFQAAQASPVSRTLSANELVARSWFIP